tara:strand:+ start:1954 stop:2901 length:948 start_codon:yes stop_codon:yes gene_type:complete
MASFHIPYPKFHSEQKIGFENSLLFIGSCFSSNVGQLSIKHGFTTLSNPFGTLFHPEPIMSGIQNAIRDSEEVFYVDTTNFVSDWNSAHVLQSSSKEEHLKLILEKRKLIRGALSGNAWLFITLGTSIAYRHISEDLVVANCHKQHAELFKKESSSPFDMFTKYSEFIKELICWNPNINIVFTVSPVRHIRDGLIENNKSKARLFVLIERLMEVHPVSYYPSFEILQDSLRDYRFFKEDMVHPNEQAMREVWKHFSESYFSKNVQSLAKKIAKLETAKTHRKINKNKDESEKLAKWIINQENEIEQLLVREKKSV